MGGPCVCLTRIGTVGASGRWIVSAIADGAGPDRPHATWSQLVRAAPELAERIRGRFAANLHHILATIRADGAPRLSDTEVGIDHDHVTVGMMPGSAKLADVRRDPRVEIHSAPFEEDLAAGDAKLAGSLVEVDADPDGTAPGASFRIVG
jgi:hypothetical protein